MKRIICKLFGHRWSDAIPDRENVIDISQPYVQRIACLRCYRAYKTRTWSPEELSVAWTCRAFWKLLHDSIVAMDNLTENPPPVSAQRIEQSRAELELAGQRLVEWLRREHPDCGRE